jgi:large subunit ribosomal protein L10
MSKYIKGLIVDDVARKLQGVNDALVCNVIGLDSEKTMQLRKELRSKGISLFVVKGSLARRAAQNTPLSSAFEATEGSMALLWGAEDFISLCKEMVGIYRKPEYEKMKSIGGVMDGERLSAEKVEEVSKWPNRAGQLSIVLGQILSPGSTLLGQLAGPGGALCSQVQQIAEGKAGKEAGASDVEASQEAAAGEPAPAA